MNKLLCIYSCVTAVMIVGTAYAQLPANPWNVSGFERATRTGGGGVAKISADSKVNEHYIPQKKYAPLNADAEAPKYVPAIDSQGNAKTGVKVKKISSNENNSTDASQENKKGTTVAQQQDIQNNNTGWRGSGQFGKLDYTGEVTTYGTAYGQEMLAPEVNQHNIGIMLNHLRDLGYKIPESYDTGYGNFLSDYKTALEKAYNGLGHQKNPFDEMFSGLLNVFESGTGLDVGNLLFNSINLISKE